MFGESKHSKLHQMWIDLLNRAKNLESGLWADNQKFCRLLRVQKSAKPLTRKDPLQLCAVALQCVLGTNKQCQKDTFSALKISRSFLFMLDASRSKEKPLSWRTWPLLYISCHSPFPLQCQRQ